MPPRSSLSLRIFHPTADPLGLEKTALTTYTARTVACETDGLNPRPPCKASLSPQPPDVYRIAVGVRGTEPGGAGQTH